METQTKEINYGFALLRLLMCFEVVLCHYWGGDGPKYLKLFSILRNTAVPVFMFLSFYLTENTFLNYKKEKALKRIERLVITQIGCSIIYYICLTIGQIKIQFGVKFTDLIWQIFSGHSPRLNPAMWFQIVLIVLSLIYDCVNLSSQFGLKKVMPNLMPPTQIKSHAVVLSSQRLYNCGLSANPLSIQSDRKSTRLNSSHQIISYAVFCLK